MLIVVAILGIFIAKLVDIQVVRASELNEAAYGKRSVPVTIYGPRGNITDENGVMLAGSIMRYNVAVSPKNTNEFTRETKAGEVTVTVADAAAEIGAITGQAPNSILKIISDALTEDPDSDFAYVKKSVDLDTYRKLDDLDIPWLWFYTDPGRTYPNGAVAGNLVGFVGSDGEPLEGLERSENECLAGHDGTETYEKSMDGVRIPGSTITSKPVKSGGTLRLTIDADLQWYAQQQLAEQVKAVGATHGMVVVQEVKTGKLVTVADYPSVDPNNVDGTAPEYRSSQAFRAPFEPGSTLKALTAAALIDTGTATPNSRVLAPYWVTFPNGARFHDSDPHPDQPLTLTGVLVESSNTGISILGDKMDDNTRMEYLKKFGLGSETSAAFYDESGGILHPVDEWDNQTKYTTMFGQGLSMTAVQVASAYQALGNNGVRLPVQLIEGCTAQDGTVTDVPKGRAGIRVVSAESAKTTVNMLESIVTQGWLTDTLTIPGYRVAAKTGTAQQADPETGGYSSKYLVSLAGLAPAEDPQYVVSVNIANPVTITSSAAAAPVFQKVMTQVLKMNRVKPSTTKSPTFPTSY